MSEPGAAAQEREAGRQRLLLGVILGDPGIEALAAAMHAGGGVGACDGRGDGTGETADEGADDGRVERQRFVRGLAAYRAHAGAQAERALSAAYPTLAELLGAQAFAALARAYRHAEPPLRGDLACWGDGLAAFIAGDEPLAGLPYLADVARLDWAVHEAASAADDRAPPAGLETLADADPGRVTLRLRAGSALLCSPYPVAAIRHAHRVPGEDGFAAARAALAAGRGDNAWVVRAGWQVQVHALDDAGARFVGALLAGRSLEAALDAAGAGFDFEAWFVAALRAAWIGAVVAADGEAAR